MPVIHDVAMCDVAMWDVAMWDAQCGLVDKLYYNIMHRCFGFAESFMKLLCYIYHSV